MASASSALRLSIQACRRAPRLQRIPRTEHMVRQSQPLARRSFTTTSTVRRARGDEDAAPYAPIELKKMDADFEEALTPEGLQQLDALAKENGFNTIDQYIESTLHNTPGWAFEDRGLLEDLKKHDKGARPNKKSFWFDDEDPETNTEELDEFDEDDITSMAHGKLDQIREMRNYARLAVWEMPLLSKLAKPFTPPAEGEVLRWRYTTYMGESHPAEKKVVVQFSTRDLDLTRVQADKLKKLAGARYNPETNVIKMSSEGFEHPAQNKRHLSNLVDELIAAAKDPSDTFEDVPLDLRHHPVAEKPRFPKAWRLTPERAQYLDELRRAEALLDGERSEQKLLVNGAEMAQAYEMSKALEDEKKQKIAEMVAAPKPGMANKANRLRR